MEKIELAIMYTLSGARVESITYLHCAGPYVLVVQTVLPERGLAIELHSTFVGHDSVPTKATHLLLGPVGNPAEIVTREDELGIVDMVNRPASCVYTHCCELTAMLGERSLDLKVDRMPSQVISLPR